MSPFLQSSLARHVDCLALEGLKREADLELKPGLVCPSANGSHNDMDWYTFDKSISSLKGYFAECFLLGARHSPLRDLQVAGLQAEQAMFQATNGVNTHKGAIFTLGLLAGAAGWQCALHGMVVPALLGKQVAKSWGPAIWQAASKAAQDPDTNGLKAGQLGVPGAREQAAGGFVHLFECTIPALQLYLRETGSGNKASSMALLATMACLPDTNLVHRGGLEGLVWAQQASMNSLRKLAQGDHGWQIEMQQLCRAFESRWLSPGGSADMLSAAWFVHGLGSVQTDLPDTLTESRSDLIWGSVQ